MGDTTNKAWAEFKTPLSQDALLLFCHDVEQLFRINPYLEVIKWKKIQPHKHYIDVLNHSQNPGFSLQTTLYVTDIANGIKLHYAKGIKSDTTIVASATVEGSKLVITENYNTHQIDSDANLLATVDKSLKQWAEEIQAYLINWNRWSWFLPWRYYKQRIWLPMKPSARRIAYMLIWISFIEIALIGLGVIVYLLDYR